VNTPVPAVGPILKTVSPSQISEFTRCARLHWLSKRAKLPQPQNEAALLGQKIHAVLERYYSTGETIEAIKHDEKLRTGLGSFLSMIAKDEDAPRYEPGLLVEYPENLEFGLFIGPTRIRGKIDLLIPPKADGVTRVSDHKTSKWSSYRKTAEELLNDPQCIVYAKFAFDQIPGTQSVVFSHNALNVAEVDGEHIATEAISREDNLAKWNAQIVPVVERMVEHFKIENFHETTPCAGGPSAAYNSPCRQFNGCPYAVYCGLDLTKKKDQPAPNPNEKTMSLKEKLAAAAGVTKSVVASKPVRATGINPPDAAPQAPVAAYVPGPDTSVDTFRLLAAFEKIELAFAEVRAALGATK
jgi:hypothetical protein